MELVVRDGRFFTIGDDGAELFTFKKGDIIFNAEQTKEIFEKGHAISNNGRGKALAEGTAFVTGTGSGRFYGGATSSSKSAAKSTSTGKSSTGKSTSRSNADDSLQIFDWIEIAIDRVERAINNLQRTATSAYQTLKTKLSATADEISKVTEEIDVQESGYNRYIQEANKVKLSDSIKQLVRDGAIDIRQYDKSTAELIKDYQEWLSNRTLPHYTVMYNVLFV